MRVEVFWRVAAVQLVAVAVLSLLFGAIFSNGFFETWGWLVGPGTWLLCAWFTARVVGLEVPPTLGWAVLAGVVSVIAVVLGLHWLGALLAIGLFAFLCARMPPHGAAWT